MENSSDAIMYLAERNSPMVEYIGSSRYYIKTKVWLKTIDIPRERN